MKKCFFFLALLTVCAQPTFAQLKVTDSNLVGIGTLNPDPNYQTTIEGAGLIIRDPELLTNSLNIKTYSPSPGFGAVDISSGADCSYSTLGINKHWRIGYIDYSYGITVQATNLYCIGTFYNYSDERIKKNIKALAFDPKVFSRLNPVSYNFLDSVKTTSTKGINNQLKFTNGTYPTQGFLAQEVQKIYPQLVEKDDSTGLLRIKTLEFIPILVKALHDQQTQIDQLTELIGKSSSVLAKVGTNPTAGTTETDALTYPVLEKNIPNPFNASTSIGFYLPTSVATANIYVYDMNGTQLKSFSLSERGKGTVSIQGSEFIAGMYLYALIADCKVIDTKRMILTK